MRDKYNIKGKSLFTRNVNSFIDPIRSKICTAMYLIVLDSGDNTCDEVHVK